MYMITIHLLIAPFFNAPVFIPHNFDTKILIIKIIPVCLYLMWVFTIKNIT